MLSQADVMLTYDFVCSALELLKAARLRPNRDIAFHVLRGCFENNRPDLAVAFCRYGKSSLDMCA